MTADEMGRILLFIRSTHPEFVVEREVVDGWTITFMEYDARDVMAAAITHNHRCKYPPKTAELIGIINETTKLEWEPGTIVAFLKRWAWDSSGSTALEKCPPNCRLFLQSGWKTMIAMQESALEKYIAVRARTYDRRSQPALPAFPEAIQKMIKGVG